MHNEQELVEIIDRLKTKLGYKFKFGYHEIDDMGQQIAVLCMEALPKWDQVRPLENFLYVYCHNRLFNMKRDNYARPDPPCLKCPLNAWKNRECTAFDNMMNCEYYERWSSRNQSKKNLMNSHEYEEGALRHSACHDDIVAQDLFNKVDKEIPISLRADWLRFVNGAKLSKAKRDKLLTTIKEIVGENE